MADPLFMPFDAYATRSEGLVWVFLLVKSGTNGSVVRPKVVLAGLGDIMSFMVEPLKLIWGIGFA